MESDAKDPPIGEIHFAPTTIPSESPNQEGSMTAEFTQTSRVRNSQIVQS